MTRSNQVDTVTTLLLMRLRFLIKKRGANAPRVAEECLLAGYTGVAGKKDWLDVKAAESLFESITPSANITDSDKKHWLSVFLKDYDQVQSNLNEIAENRAYDFSQSNNRVQASITGAKVSSESITPVDVLAVMIILPAPSI